MKISHINWLSKAAKEAEVEIRDTDNFIIVYSQPCNYQIDQVIDEYLRPLEVENLQKSNARFTKIEKLDTSYFGYKITAKINDFENSIVSVGNIKFEFNTPIPSWAEEGDIIEFESIRIDLW